MMKRLTIPLLAVDGGGTKCRAVLVDRERNILGSAGAGACNYQGVGRAAAELELAKAIEAAVSALKRPSQQPIEVECAVLGLAGLDTEYDRKILLEMVKQVLTRLNIVAKNLLVENDGLVALLGATNGEPGVLVIAGTGSIAYGINEQGISARTGGWGHRVGDEGSGYWIGKNAITAILQAADGRGEVTELAASILPYLGLRDAEELFNWTYSSRYSVENVGELSRLVSAVAAGGDAVAKRILAAAGEELFAAAKAVIDRLDMRHKEFTYILQGGVLQNEGVIRALVVERLQQYSPLAKLDLAKNEPIYGVIAKGLAYLRGE